MYSLLALRLARNQAIPAALELQIPPRDFFSLPHQVTPTMPQFHLIVRTESEEKVLPPHKITDITITGLPADIEFDKSKIFDTHTVIDSEANNGSWTYRIAVHIDKEPSCERDVHISYGTMDREDALRRLRTIPDAVIEANESRGEADEKASAKWCGMTLIHIRLRRDTWMWYELVTVDVEDCGKWVANEEKETEEGRAGKRRKLEIQEAVGEDSDIFDDEEDMDELQGVVRSSSVLFLADRPRKGRSEACGCRSGMTRVA